MKNARKTKEQLVDELMEMRRRIAELEAAGAERKRAEERLQYRVEMEKHIAAISTNFIRLSSDEVDTGINWALQTIGQFTGVDRSYVFLFSDDGTKMDNTHEWCVEGVEPQIENLQGLYTDAFPWWMEKLNRFESIHIPRVADLPSEASAEKEILQAQDIWSLLVVPMVYSEALIGFVGFDLVRAEKTWAEEDIVLLKTLGDIFVNALGRKWAREDLLREKHFSESVTNSLPGIFYLFDDKGNFIRWNKNLEKVSGYSSEEISGMSPLNLLVGGDREVVAGKIQEVFNKGKAAVEANLISKSGKKSPYYFTGLRMRMGDATYLIGMGIDITERKQVEEALRESEEKYRNLVERANDGITIIQDGIVKYVNPRLAEMRGETVEEIIGTSFTDYVYPDELPKVVDRYKRRMAGEEVTPIYETVLRRKDGSKVYAELNTGVITYQGKPADLVMVRDITERKRAEEALQESEEKYRLLVENQTDLVVKVDTEGRFQFVSSSYCELFGKREEELLGKTFMPLVYEGDREATARAMEDLYRPPYTCYVEQRALTKDGWRWLAWADKAVLDQEGNIVAVVGVGRDITERKQLEAQVREMQKMEAIGQLAAGIAHDFNNLLTPIGGFAELLLGKAAEGSQQHEYLRQIKIAAERAAALTGQLRLFTRQEKGERHPVQLNSVVEETRALLERSIPKEITIELHLESELWAVEADPSQMSQVLMNLCVNARDAMPDGGILTLETRNVTLDGEWARAILEARPGRYVCLRVSDTGSGMSPAVQARLFEPFFTTKEMGRGTGLGLSVVYGIVKGHGGFIQVYSQEGRGSAFHVYLPAIESAVEEREVERLELPTGTETILVVDDEETVRALGRSVLELCGYTVLTAEDGLQALEVYRAHRGEVALVVLDVVMPQMGGLECLRRLRELDLEVKVLISTGYTAKGLAQELVAEGALGVVEKPFLLQDFAVAVRTTLDKS